MIKISPVLGNGQRLDGGAMFGNVPRALWQKWTEVDDRGRIQLATRAFLVEQNGVKALLEAGIGCFFSPNLAERFGVQNPESHILIDSLRELGVHPSDITHVILSHLHFDHAGGLLTPFRESGEFGLVFEKAQYIVSEEAWNRAQNPHPRDRASFIPELNALLKRYPRFNVLPKGTETTDELPDGMRFFESQGHTPGHLHTVVQGREGGFVFAGDLIPGKSWIHLPVTMGYDRFPELLIEEKQKLYDLCLNKGYFLGFTHDTDHAFAQVSFNGKAYTATNSTNQPLNFSR